MNAATLLYAKQPFAGKTMLRMRYHRLTKRAITLKGKQWRPKGVVLLADAVTEDADVAAKNGGTRL